MKKAIVLLFLFFCFGLNSHIKSSFGQVESVKNTRLYPDPANIVTFNPIATYEGEPDENLKDVMVPIPMKDRVFNKTSIQCVWCSLETIGRYAEEPKLIDLTEQKDCKSYASPSSAARKLNELGIRFEQTTSTKDRSLIIKSVVQEKRGCLFSIPGHAMTLVHYDEEKGIVKYINNSDSSLQIRTWSMSEFNRRWDGWVCVIYADKDIIPDKYKPKVPDLPIIDRNGPQGLYPTDYVFSPSKT